MLVHFQQEQEGVFVIHLCRCAPLIGLRGMQPILIVISVLSISVIVHCGYAGLKQGKPNN